MYEAGGSVCRMMELLVVLECLYVYVLFVMAVLFLLFCGDISWGCALFAFSLLFFSYVDADANMLHRVCQKGAILQGRLSL